MTDKEFSELFVTWSKFCELNSEFSDHFIIQGFSRDKAISMVFSSNKLENTVSTGVKHNNTYVILKSVLLDFPVRVMAWNSDRNLGTSANQLAQHLKAYYQIMSLKRLTVKGLLETHSILMLGALSDDDTPILSGKIRTFKVNNGIEDYLSYEVVEEELHKLMLWYSKANNSDPVEVAYKLFYKFIKIHPLKDSNRRMARLLIVYHLSASRTPFPVCVTSGKKRSQKHYYDAMKKEELLYYDRTDLYMQISHSVYLGWKNFFESEK